MEDTVQTREDLFGHEKSVAESKDYIDVYSYIATYGPIKFRDWRTMDVVDRSHKNTWFWLVDNGFIEERGDERIGYAVPIPIHATAYAFELKPKNWEKAMEQALRASGTGERNRPRPGPWDFIHGYADYASIVVEQHALDKHNEDYQSKKFKYGIGAYTADRHQLEQLKSPPQQFPVRYSRDRILLNEITYAGKDPVWGKGYMTIDNTNLERDAE